MQTLIDLFDRFRKGVSLELGDGRVYRWCDESTWREWDPITREWLDVNRIDVKDLVSPCQELVDSKQAVFDFPTVLKMLSLGNGHSFTSMDGTKTIRADQHGKSVLSYDGHGGWGDDPDLLGNYRLSWMRKDHHEA